MDWKKVYGERVTTAKKAVEAVKAGDKILPSHAAAEPKHIIYALLDRKELVLSIDHILCMKEYPAGRILLFNGFQVVFQSR